MRMTRPAAARLALAMGIPAALLLSACSPNPAPFDNKTIVVYPLTTIPAGPMGVTLGPDGNIWTAENFHSAVARITPAGVVTEFPLTTAGSQPVDIVTGPDNNLWVTEQSASKIARVTTAGVVTEFPTATASASPYGIAVGPDGRLWYTESANAVNKIGAMTTAGVTSDFAITTANSSAFGITAGPNGNLWFAENATAKVGEITTAGAMVNEFALTANARPYGITTGPDGRLWVADSAISGGSPSGGTPGLARVTTAGVVVEFPVPGGTTTTPVDVVSGPDGNVWYTNAGGNVGRMTTAGVATQFPIPTAFAISQLTGIARGPGNTLWFGEQNASPPPPVQDSVSFFDPVPTVTAVVPSSGAATGNQSVSVACTGCRGTTTVHWGATNITTTPCPASPSAPCFDINAGGTAVTVNTPAGSNGQVVDVTLTTPYATSTVVAADKYTYKGIADSVTLTIAPASPRAGDTVTFSGSVTASGLPKPTGTVTLRDNGVDVNGCVNLTLNASGGATCTAVVNATNHAFTLVYSGDAVYAANQSAVLAVSLAAGSPPVPGTGTGIPWLPVAALTTLGGALIIAARRRSNR